MKLVWTLAVLLPLAATAQPPFRPPAAQAEAPAELAPEDAASISGHVTDAVTGEPLRNAQVSAIPTVRDSAPTFVIQTDAKGAFLLNNMPPVSYHLGTRRTGYVTGEYGARGSSRSGATLALEPGQKMTDLKIELKPGGVIAGRVVDEFGDPVERLSVTAMQYRYIDGERILSRSTASPTNDLGEYRIFGLAPGRYYVQTSPGSMFQTEMSADPEAGQETYVPVYYPNVTEEAMAAPLDMREGSQMLGIDLQLIRRRTYRISADVINQVGAAGRIMAQLRPASRSFGLPQLTTVTGNRATFEGVRPGSYSLILAMSEGGRSFSGRAEIEVADKNITGVEVSLTPGVDVPGRLEIEDSAPLDLRRLRINLRGQGSGVTRVMSSAGTFTFGVSGNETADESGEFVFRGLAPDAASVDVIGLPDEFYLKSARLGDQDVLESGLDLRSGVPGELRLLVSNKAGIVSGTVHDSEGQPAAGITVVLVPDSEARRRQPQFYKQTNTDQQGNFRLASVVPGGYRIYGWDGVEPNAWMDPDFVASFRNQAMIVDVSESDRPQLDLKALTVE